VGRLDVDEPIFLSKYYDTRIQVFVIFVSYFLDYI